MSRYIRYKYQKQQINFLNCDDLNKWIDTCQTRIVGFDSVCSSSCNCKEYDTDEYEPIIQYKKLNPNYNYECLDGNRHYRLLKQISYDNGISWFDTNEYQIGDVYEANSPWCNATEILMDWFEERTECNGTDEYSIEIKRVSLDGGVSWTDMGYTDENGVTTYETRRLKLEENSCNCGAIGCDNYISFKWDGTTQDYCRYNIGYTRYSATTANSVDNGDGTYTFTANARDIMGTNADKVERRMTFRESYNLIEPYILFNDGENAEYKNNLEEFFYNSGLKQLNATIFGDTSNVTDMSEMFYGCSSLTLLDLTNFSTSNVTTMENMFYYCSSLTSLDLSNFDTSNVTNMYRMFYGCSGLTELDLSSFDTSNVNSMNSMFYSCSGLTSLNVSGWNISGVTSYASMFYGCVSLEKLIIGEVDEYTYNWWLARLTAAGIQANVTITEV